LAKYRQKVADLLALSDRPVVHKLIPPPTQLVVAHANASQLAEKELRTIMSGPQGERMMSCVAAAIQRGNCVLLEGSVDFTKDTLSDSSDSSNFMLIDINIFQSDSPVPATTSSASLASLATFDEAILSLEKSE